jgi:hypothetical protein
VQDRERDVAAEQAAARLERQRRPVANPATVALERDLDRLVAALLEPRPDRRPRRERDVVLARAAAGEDRDPHCAGGVAGGSAAGAS